MLRVHTTMARRSLCAQAHVLRQKRARPRWSQSGRKSCPSRNNVVAHANEGTGTDSNEEIRKLLEVLPSNLRSLVEERTDFGQLIEVVLDLGRKPTARFPTGEVALRDAPLEREEVEDALRACGEFGTDNRAGMEATLHRVSAIRSRSGTIVGLTCRVGRAVEGSAALAKEEIMGGKSILFLGRPGVGKTTSIREASRLLAGELGKRVVIVDTSNEIGGDGDVPHPGIGSARRMQVPRREKQHEVMIEAVENHMPEVIVIDEIGTNEEALAARTIAQRGVQLIATAHGHTLENLTKNPSLVELVGGIESVTLGDDTARARGVQKAVQERRAPPTFECAVEMTDIGCWAVHKDTAWAVDRILAGKHVPAQVRTTADYRERNGLSEDSFIAPSGAGTTSHSGDPMKGEGLSYPREEVYFSWRQQDELSGSWSSSFDIEDSGSDAYSPARPPTSLWDVPAALKSAAGGGGPPSSKQRGEEKRQKDKVVRIYPFQMAESELKRVIESMGLEEKVQITDDPETADAYMAVRAALENGGGFIRSRAKERNVPVYAVKTAAMQQLAKAVRAALSGQVSSDSSDEPPPGDEGEEREALDEARSAAEQIVIPTGKAVELGPRKPALVARQASFLRQQYNLQVMNVGKGEGSRLRILPASARVM